MIASGRKNLVTETMMQQSRTDLGQEDAATGVAGNSRALAGASSSARGKSREQTPATRPTKWSKTTVNFVVDAGLLLLVVTLLFTAAVLRFVFPIPSTSAGWTLW
jgi:hypothetical protein